jgi:hypothetical protein
VTTSPVDVLIMTALGKELDAVVKQSDSAWIPEGATGTRRALRRAVTRPD